MLNDARMRSLIDFPDATEAFPGTQIKGGVSYFLWDRNWDDGCEVTTIEKGKPTSPPIRRHLNTYDVLVRRNEALPILKKFLTSVTKRNTEVLSPVSHQYSLSVFEQTFEAHLHRKV